MAKKVVELTPAEIAYRREVAREAVEYMLERLSIIWPPSVIGDVVYHLWPNQPSLRVVADPHKSDILWRVSPTEFHLTSGDSKTSRTLEYSDNGGLSWTRGVRGEFYHTPERAALWHGLFQTPYESRLTGVE